MRETPFRGRWWQKAGVAAATAGVLLGAPNWAHAQAASTAQEASKQVTFTKDVAPMFQAKCQQCHRPGQMAPMSLLTYEDARPWARSIRAKIASREMPPWYIDPTVGIQKFQNDYSITEEQRETIIRWVDAGAPLGDPKDLPPPKQWPDDKGWRLAQRFGRPPDVVVKPTAWKVPAQGPDQWWKPIVDIGLTEDRWVQAIEMKPSDRRVVHHATTFLFQQEDAAVLEAEQALRLRNGKGSVEALLAAMRNPSGRLVDFSEDTAPIFAEWAVGKEGEIYSQNTGKLVRAGAKLGFHIHYHSVGEEVTDVTEAGLWFYPKGDVPKHIVRWFSIASVRNLEIPPGKQTIHHGYTVLPAAAIIQNFQPHMHIRGKAYALEAIYPDGRIEVLNYADRFRFNWSINYVYAEDAAPVLPKGTILHATSWHDNTAMNKDNPDPRQWVTNGDRTIDEMSHANTQVVYLTEEDYERIVKERKARATPTTNNNN